MRALHSILLLAAIAMACAPALAQRTTRPGLKSLRQSMPMAAHADFDTIALDSTCLRLSGYEKTLRSAVESLFITNKSEAELSGITLQIQYLDMKGRQLHSRLVTVDVTVPPGETRMGRFASWDKQKVWYYYLSDPVRTRMQATPYRVAILPVSALATHADTPSQALERTDSIDK